MVRTMEQEEKYLKFHVGVPEGEKDGCGGDFDGDGNCVGVEVVPSDSAFLCQIIPLFADRVYLPKSKATRRVRPTSGEVGKCTRDRCMRCHLSDSTER